MVVEPALRGVDHQSEQLQRTGLARVPWGSSHPPGHRQPRPARCTLMQGKSIRTQNRRGYQQTPLAPVALDRYLTRQLHKTAGFNAVRLAAGYRLRAPDARGCNWSGDITV